MIRTKDARREWPYGASQPRKYVSSGPLSQGVFCIVRKHDDVGAGGNIVGS